MTNDVQSEYYYFIFVFVFVGIFSLLALSSWRNRKMGASFFW